MPKTKPARAARKAAKLPIPPRRYQEAVRAPKRASAPARPSAPLPKRRGRPPKTVAKVGKAAKPINGQKSPREGSKLALIAEMLRRKNGCTAEEVKKATGWPAVSMPTQARLAGLKLFKEKVGKHFIYFAV